MSILPLIILGYERDRHIAGLHLLAATKPGQRIRRIYLALPKPKPYHDIAEENAKHIIEIATKFFPDVTVQKLDFDSYSFQDIAELLAYVIEKERGKEEIWIDLTSTTKEVISLSTFFTLFGMRAYWITSPPAEEATRLEERIYESFKATEKKFFEWQTELLMKLKVQKNHPNLEKEVNNLFEKLIRMYTNKTIDQIKSRKATGLVEMPIVSSGKRSALLKPIKLSKNHKKLLADLKVSDRSLAELLEINKNLTEMKIRYALMNLRGIGFVTRQQTEYKLTEIGLGYANGLEKVNDEI